MPDKPRGSGFGQPGVRVWLTETKFSEIVWPFLHLICFLGAVAGMLAVIGLDGVILGVEISHALITLFIIFSGLSLCWLIYRLLWPPELYWWIGAFTVITLILAFTWMQQGYSGLRDMWPGWRPRVHPFIKILLQPFFMAAQIGLAFYAIRQLVEIVDPQHSSRHAANFAGTGLAPNMPTRWLVDTLVRMNGWLTEHKGEKPETATRPGKPPSKDDVPLPKTTRLAATEEERYHSLCTYCAGVMRGAKVLSREGAINHGWQRPAYEEFAQFLTTMPSKKDPYAYFGSKKELNLTPKGIDWFIDYGSEILPELRRLYDDGACAPQFYPSPTPEEEEGIGNP
jgi:hypothetical protein